MMRMVQSVSYVISLSWRMGAVCGKSAVSRGTMKLSRLLCYTRKVKYKVAQAMKAYGEWSYSSVYLRTTYKDVAQ
jgi:hypothetical protein